MNAPELGRYQDTILVVSSTPRNVNTKYGQKQVWDITAQDGRKFQSWEAGIGMQAANLAGQQVTVVYVEKPSRDPQYPPNLEVESLTPQPGFTGAAAQAQPGPPPQAQPAAQPQPQQPPAPQPAPVPAPMAPQAAPQPQAASPAAGPMTEHDKECMRRSAAVKAASYAWAADPEQDYWKLVDQILVYIETGNDPVPFLGSGAETSQYVPS